jgi:serine O-acetyltransferase
MKAVDYRKGDANMIKTRSDLKRYLLNDRLADNITKSRPKILGGCAEIIWKYKIFLRKAEFFMNNSDKNFFNKMIGKYYTFKLGKLGCHLGFSIPLNTTEEGLSLPHYGSIVINSTAKIGKNCRILVGTVIGVKSGFKQAATLGSNVYIGAGAKIIGDITIGDYVTIGANSVVVKNVESHITVAGIPAKKINNNDSSANLSNLLRKECV